MHYFTLQREASVQSLNESTFDSSSAVAKVTVGKFRLHVHCRDLVTANHISLLAYFGGLTYLNCGGETLHCSLTVQRRCECFWLEQIVKSAVVETDLFRLLETTLCYIPFYFGLNYFEYYDVSLHYDLSFLPAEQLSRILPLSEANLPGEIRFL